MDSFNSRGYAGFVHVVQSKSPLKPFKWMAGNAHAGSRIVSAMTMRRLYTLPTLWCTLMIGPGMLVALGLFGRVDMNSNIPGICDPSLDFTDSEFKAAKEKLLRPW